MKSRDIEKRLDYLQAVVDSQVSPTDVIQLGAQHEEQFIHVDVRVAPAEMKKNKVLGAKEIPLLELKERLHELPKDKQIIVSTWGPTCALAKEASIILLNAGFDCVELSGGVALWEEFHFPVEQAIYDGTVR